VVEVVADLVHLLWLLQQVRQTPAAVEVAVLEVLMQVALLAKTAAVVL
jgi:hypothetical protein